MHKKSITSCLAFKTPYGWITVFATKKGIHRIKFGKFMERKSLLLHVVGASSTCDNMERPAKGKVAKPGFDKSNPYKDVETRLNGIKDNILDYLSGKQVKFNYSLDLSLTSFQEKVLKEVKKIPYGKTISYKELAKRVKTSPRACAQALAGNPVPIIIPCHRVIQANGSPGGFSGGIKWKINLLRLENEVWINSDFKRF